MYIVCIWCISSCDFVVTSIGQGIFSSPGLMMPYFINLFNSPYDGSYAKALCIRVRVRMRVCVLVCISKKHWSVEALRRQNYTYILYTKAAKEAEKFTVFIVVEGEDFCARKIGWIELLFAKQMTFPIPYVYSTSIITIIMICEWEKAKEETVQFQKHFTSQSRWNGSFWIQSNRKIFCTLE